MIHIIFEQSGSKYVKNKKGFTVLDQSDATIKVTVTNDNKIVFDGTEKRDEFFELLHGLSKLIYRHL